MARAERFTKVPLPLMTTPRPVHRALRP
jgi:hypothetical protein